MDQEEQAGRPDAQLSGDAIARESHGVQIAWARATGTTGADGSGCIVLLLALAIVAWLAKDALKQYGLVSGAPTASEPTASSASPTPAAVSDYSGGGASPSFQAPIERARGVEETVRRGAEAQTRQTDDATR